MLLALHFLFIYLFDFAIIFITVCGIGGEGVGGCQLLHGVARSVLYLLGECAPHNSTTPSPLTPRSQTNKRDRTNLATLARSGWLTLHRLLLPGPSEAAAAAATAASDVSPRLTTPGVFEGGR